jgi:hypothetical protein
MISLPISSISRGLKPKPREAALAETNSRYGCLTDVRDLGLLEFVRFASMGFGVFRLAGSGFARIALLRLGVLTLAGLGFARLAFLGLGVFIAERP